MSARFISQRAAAEFTSPDCILAVPAHGFGQLDEDVLRQRLEKPYWQVIASESDFQSTPSIDPSSLTRWRKRLG